MEPARPFNEGDENNMNAHNKVPSSASPPFSKEDASNTNTTSNSNLKRRSPTPPMRSSSSSSHEHLHERPVSGESDASSNSGNSETRSDSESRLLEEEKATEVDDETGKNGFGDLETSQSRTSSSSASLESVGSSNSGRLYTPSRPPHAPSATTTTVFPHRQRGSLGLTHPQMNLVCSFITLGQIVSCITISQEFAREIRRYLGSLRDLDLSHFWGVIGSTDSSFYDFLTQCTNVRSVTLDYCVQLKSSHLDRILHKLCPVDQETNDRITRLSLYYCKKLGAQATFKIAARLPNLQSLNLGRCHLTTSHDNINGLKALTQLPLSTLAITLNPDLERNDVMEIVSLLIYDDAFTHLRILDLSVGCRLLTHSDVDLDDIRERGIQIVGLLKTRRH